MKIHKYNRVKFFLVWLLFALFANGENKDPFDEQKVSEKKSDEMVYDFADVHCWDDIHQKLDSVVEQRIINWTSSFIARHKEVTGKSQILEFRINANMYKKSVLHTDLNRGVVLMAGDPRFPLLECQLRPFSVQNGEASFVVNIPVDRLKEMYIAFIPSEGKKRYLYSLNEVVLSFKKTK